MSFDEREQLIGCLEAMLTAFAVQLQLWFPLFHFILHSKSPAEAGF